MNEKARLALIETMVSYLNDSKDMAYRLGKGHRRWDYVKRHLEYQPRQIGKWFEIAVCYICGYLWRQSGYTFRVEYSVELDMAGIDLQLKHFGRRINLQLKYGQDNNTAPDGVYTVLWQPGMTPANLLSQMRFNLLFTEFGDRWLRLNQDEWNTIHNVLMGINKMYQIRRSHYENQ